MLSPRFETERLILRRYKESDIDAIYDIITDKRLSTYIKFSSLSKYEEYALKIVSDHLLNDTGYYLVECSCNELNKQSFRVMEKAGFKKDGYIVNRRLNRDGTYSGVEYYSKTKNE